MYSKKEKNGFSNLKNRKKFDKKGISWHNTEDELWFVPLLG